PEMGNLFRKTRLQPPECAVHTFPSWKPQRAIDHILVSDNLRREGLRAVPAAYSDHLALSLDLDVPEAALQRWPRPAPAHGTGRGGTPARSRSPPARTRTCPAGRRSRRRSRIGRASCRDRVLIHVEADSHKTRSLMRLTFSINRTQSTRPLKSVTRG